MYGFLLSYFDMGSNFASFLLLSLSLHSDALDGHFLFQHTTYETPKAWVVYRHSSVVICRGAMRSYRKSHDRKWRQSRDRNSRDFPPYFFPLHFPRISPRTFFRTFPSIFPPSYFPPRTFSIFLFLISRIFPHRIPPYFFRTSISRNFSLVFCLRIFFPVLFPRTFFPFSPLPPVFF